MMSGLRRHGIDWRFLTGALLMILIIPLLVAFLTLATGTGGQDGAAPVGYAIVFFAGLMMVALISAAAGLPVAIPTWILVFAVTRRLGLTPRQCALLSVVVTCFAASAPLLFRMPPLVWLTVAVILAVTGVLFALIAYHGSTWEDFA